MMTILELKKQLILTAQLLDSERDGARIAELLTLRSILKDTIIEALESPELKHEKRIS